MHFESSPSGTDEKAAESLSNISLLLLVKSYGDVFMGGTVGG